MEANGSIDIILPIGPHSPYLEQSLHSISVQSYDKWRVVALLNSNDFTNILITKKLIPDSQLIIHSFNDTFNLSKRLNFAIEKSGADFIARMDSDDVMRFDRLENQVKYFASNKKIALIGTSVEVIDQNNEIIFEIIGRCGTKEISNNLLLRNQFIHPTLMWRRIDLRDFEFDERLIVSQDYGFFLDVGQFIEMDNIPDKLLRYRVHLKNHSLKRITNKEIMIICYKKARYGVRKKRNIFIVTISIVSWALKNILISPVQSLKIRITASKFLTRFNIKKIKFD